MRAPLCAAALAWLAGCGDDLGARGVATADAGRSDAGVQVTVAISVVGAGEGMVTSPELGIACHDAGGECTAVVDAGATVELTARPRAGYLFNGWLGGCGRSPICTVTAGAGIELAASFAMLAYTSSGTIDGEDVGLETSNVWVSRTDGVGAVALAPLTAAATWSRSPSWSPDGTRIVFVSARDITGGTSTPPSAYFNVWVVDADGEGVAALTQLTVDGGLADGPQWSPDGSRIAYVANHVLDGSDEVVGATNLWVVRTDGSGRIPLTRNTEGAVVGNATWSPDGTRLLVESNMDLGGADAINDNGTSNIWSVRADGSGAQPLTGLTAAGAGAVRAVWSPDGTAVAYESARALDGSDAALAAATNIWVMDADGGGSEPLTMNTAGGSISGHPSWSPHGERIYFDSTGALDGDDGVNRAGTANIWVVGADGTGKAALTSGTTDGAHSRLPRPALDGSTIFFQSRRAVGGGSGVNPNGRPNVWRMSASTRSVAPVTRYTGPGAFAESVAPGY